MTLAYIDTYWILATGAAIMCGLSLFLRKNVATWETLQFQAEDDP